MIRNPQELDVVRQQIERLESALRALVRDVRPHSEERYQLVAEAYEEQLSALRRQVDSYNKRAKQAAEDVPQPPPRAAAG